MDGESESDSIEHKSSSQMRDDIIKARIQLTKDAVDMLKEKSSIAGEQDRDEQLKFSSYIRNAYVDIQASFNGNTKVIMEIIANVPDIKIIFLPNEDNIRKYEEDEEPDYILKGITYAKSETIIIAAKGYDKEEAYRKILGVIIHEFCHFAIHEIFGNMFKPFYNDDMLAAEKWEELVVKYESIDLSYFPVIKEVFNYDRTRWVDELIVRFPQNYVEHHNNTEFLSDFEETFSDLRNFYFKCVHGEFESEKEKIASLRSVNDKNFLRSVELYKNSSSKNLSIDLNAQRQVVTTNDTSLLTINIYKKFKKKYNFKSTFMFIDMNFLISDENLKIIQKALQCKKVTTLIIDSHNKTFAPKGTRIFLDSLMESSHCGRITLILHQTHTFSVLKGVMDHQNIMFPTSNLTGAAHFNYFTVLFDNIFYSIVIGSAGIAIFVSVLSTHQNFLDNPLLIIPEGQDFSWNKALASTGWLFQSFIPEVPKLTFSRVFKAIHPWIYFIFGLGILCA